MVRTKENPLVNNRLGNPGKSSCKGVTGWKLKYREVGWSVSRWQDLKTDVGGVWQSG